MAMLTKHQIYQDEEKSIEEFCECGSLMNCQSIFHRHTELNDLDSYYSLETYKILLCPTCKSVSIIFYSALLDTDHDEQFHEQDEPIKRVYTRKVLWGPVKPQHKAIPWTIADVVEQAESVLTISPRASIILCRAVLEQVCNDFDIPRERLNKDGKLVPVTLHHRLERLVDKESLPNNLKKMLDSIKDIGNLGAHGTQFDFKYTMKVSSEDASNLIGLIHYVIERLYVHKAREEEALQTLRQLEKRFLNLE